MQSLPAAPKKRFWTRRRQILAVVLLATILRVWAAWQLPVDFDEPVYLQAAYDYAHAIRSGDLGAIIDYAGNREHPPLVKLLYAGAILVQGGSSLPENVFFAARLVSVLFGVLAVWLVALFDPLAGALLAVHTIAVKYTSQAYLEALPLFASLLSLAALLRSSKPRDRWFWISALSLGLTAAGKYSYFPILIVILAIFLWEKRYAWQDLGLYLLVAGGTFFALDPALWHDPVRRLAGSVTFHALYSQGSHVQEVGYPWYQPFVWVFTSAAATWHPEVYFYYGVDGLIAILGSLGWPQEWRERRWVAVWIVSGMVFLLLWPTKWPQYSLVIIPAFCLSAVTAARRIVAWAREQETYWSWLSEMIAVPSRGLVTVFVLLLFIVMGSPVYTAIRQGLNRRGWDRLTQLNSVLPGDTVYDIVAGPGRTMIVGSEGGAVIFTLSPETQLPESWEELYTQNSGLPDNRVYDVEIGPQEEIWFATQSGMGRYQSGAWETFRAPDFGLAGEQVMAVETGANGWVWAATNAGLAAYDGLSWVAYDPTDAGLADNYVMSLAIQSQGGRETIWVGTRTGLARLDPETGAWSRAPQNPDLGSGGVAGLLVDSSDRLWVATLGGGLSMWDGNTWTRYLVSNSGIPSDTVGGIFEMEPGVFWVAAVNPTTAGGILMTFDGNKWERFTPNNSGFSGAEPLSFALDPDNRLWIGTRTAGIDLYRLPHK